MSFNSHSFISITPSIGGSIQSPADFDFLGPEFSEMDGELKQKINKYAHAVFDAAYHTSLHHTAQKITATKNMLASKGKILSGETILSIAEIQGEHINTVVQARADSLLDGYELHGAEIDDFILQEANAWRWKLIDTLSANDASSGLPPGVPARELFKPQLVTNTGAIINTITAQIERRRIVPKLKPPTSVQHVYHLHGHNSRVNIQSNDNSTNVVNLSSQEVFLQLRQRISEGIAGEEQREILKRLEELEKARNTPRLAESYMKFMAIASDHWTLISPFIPALTELLVKTLG